MTKLAVLNQRHLDDVDAAYTELSRVCDQNGKPFHAAQRLARSINEGEVPLAEAIAIVIRLIEGRTTPMKSTIEGTIESFKSQLSDMDTEIADHETKISDLKDRRRQTARAITALEKIGTRGGGLPPRVASPEPRRILPTRSTARSTTATSGSGRARPCGCTSSGRTASRATSSTPWSGRRLSESSTDPRRARLGGRSAARGRTSDGDPRVRSRARL